MRSSAGRRHYKGPELLTQHQPEFIGRGQAFQLLPGLSEDIDERVKAFLDRPGEGD
jgi:hypothetical protein